MAWWHNATHGTWNGEWHGMTWHGIWWMWWWWTWWHGMAWHSASNHPIHTVFFVLWWVIDSLHPSPSFLHYISLSSTSQYLCFLLGLCGSSRWSLVCVLGWGPISYTCISLCPIHLKKMIELRLGICRRTSHVHRSDPTRFNKVFVCLITYLGNCRWVLQFMSIYRIGGLLYTFRSLLSLLCLSNMPLVRNFLY